VSERRARLARGAWLVIAAGVLFTLGYDLYAREFLLNPPDRTLIARYRAHREGFDELLGLERAHLKDIGFGLTRGDGSRRRSALARGDRRWLALTRELRLEGDNRVMSDSLVYFAAAAWFPRRRFADVKGYAYASRPPENLVEDLDAVPPRPRRRGEVLRWHRPLSGNWYLFREIGGQTR
jgi:hypothetical protein